MSELRIRLPELHTGQAEVKADTARFKVLDCGRRWGKNIYAHEYVVDGVLEGAPVGWGSPTYKNLTEDWRTLQNLLAPLISRPSEQERRLEFVTGAVLEMWSLDSPDPIRGRKYKRWVTNEAATAPYLAATWNEIVRATLIDLKGGALFLSTPKGLNDFHTLYSWGLGSQPDWKSWRFTSYDNPHIDPAELDAMRATLSDQQFRQEIMAEFVQSEGAVFRNLDAALTAPYDKPEAHKGHTIVGGSDWGKVNDFTVNALNCCDCGREVAIDRFNQIDYHFQVQRLEEMHYRWGVKRWKVELNSIGQPVFEMLVRKGIPVVGFTTTLVSKAPLIEGFALGIERGDIKLLPDDAGRSELQAYEAKRTSAGNTTYSAPDGMHDDTIMARALAYQLMRETPAPDPKRQARQREMADARKVLFG